MKKLVTKSIGVMLILISLFYTFIGCVNNGDNTDGSENEQGEANMPQGGGCETSWLAIKFYFEKEKYDINDVRITVSYGGAFYDEAMVENDRKHSIDYPCFDIYIFDVNRSKHLIRHVNENLVSTKYSYSPDLDNNTPIEDRIFNHSETITIPEKVFTQSNGYIIFAIFGKNMHSTNSEYGVISEKIIYYQIEENNVVLSDKKF